ARRPLAPSTPAPGRVPLHAENPACSTPALRSTSTSANLNSAAIGVAPLITDPGNRDENHPVAFRVNSLSIYTGPGTVPQPGLGARPRPGGTVDSLRPDLCRDVATTFVGAIAMRAVIVTRWHGG